MNYCRLLFKLPRIVPDQKEKFEGDDIFKKHSRDSEVRYTLYRDKSHRERQEKFKSGCRDGHTEIVSARSQYQKYFDRFLLWVLIDFHVQTHLS